MHKISKPLIYILLLGLLMAGMLPATAWANSAEPPSLIILVNNPPSDLSIVLASNKNMPEAMVKRVAWEGYYVFYSEVMQKSDEYLIKVTTNDKSFTCKIDTPLKYYNNVFTLDLSRQQLTPGTYPLRSVLLVSIRLLLTLFIEGFIFWLFGFRSKKSWLIFIVTNLITQGALNIWLNTGTSLMGSYLILSLFFGEFFVFLAELIALPALLNEHGKLRILLFTFLANLVSLIAGGYIITVLPV